MSLRVATNPTVIGASICWTHPSDGAEEGAEPRRSYNLPRGDASATLRQFATVSETPVLFMMDKVRGEQTNAVAGDYSSTEALDRMLAGTELGFMRDDTTGGFVVSRRRNVDDHDSRPESNRTGKRMKTPSSNQRAMMLAAAIAAAGSVSAQTVPPGPATASPPPSGQTEETIVELSPFVVNANDDQGYAAANTLSGSRLNTSLKDTAASISVFTEEFLKDIAATNLDEIMTYANNTVIDVDDDGSFGDGPGGNPTYTGFGHHRVRGMRATRARNFFAWDLPVNAYNLGRVDDSRGPNSVLFGIGSAGGTINVSTKQAELERSFQQGSVMTDNNGSYRGTLDVNRSFLDRNLGLRLNAVHSRTDTHRWFQFNESRQVFLAAKFRVFENTTLRAEVEQGDIHENVQRVGTPLDAVSTWITAGRPTVAAPIAADPTRGIGRYPATRRVTYTGNNDSLMDFSLQNISTSTPVMQALGDLIDYSMAPAGSGAIRDIDFETHSVFLEQAFGKNTFLELAFNHQENDWFSNQPLLDGYTILADPNQTLRNGSTNPYAGNLMIDGSWVRWQQDQESDAYRATFTTSFDAGKWGHYRFAAMGEWRDYGLENHLLANVWEGRPFSTVPENANNYVWRRNYVTEGDWKTYYIPPPTPIVSLTDPSTGRLLSSTYVERRGVIANENRLKTGLFGLHARYLDGRLVAGLGYRTDRLRARTFSSTRDPSTQEWVLHRDIISREDTFKGNTRTLGVVGHITKNLSLLYNRADNFDLPNTNARILPDSTYPPPPEGKGSDVGLALSLFDGRVYAKAVYYTSDQKGITGFAFGSTFTNPSALNRRVLQALADAGAITEEEREARNNIDTTQSTLDKTSDGYEFSVVANPTKSWRLQANFSITDFTQANIAPEVFAWVAENFPYFERFDVNTIMTTEGITIAQDLQRFRDYMDLQKSFDGIGGLGNRRYKFNLFTKYTLKSGPMKGLSFGGGYRYQSKLLVGRYPGADGALLWGNSFWMADAVLGYQFGEVGFLKNLNLQLNISNLFDEQDPLITRLNPTTPPTIYRFALLPPRMWRLTANFGF